MSTTYFVAELQCPGCGRRTPADDSTGLGTPLVMYGPEVWPVGSGSDEFGWENIAAWYPVLREPAPGEPVQLLARWTCPYDSSLNWARITFADTVVTAIEVVPFDVPTVAAAHAVSDDVEEVYRELTGAELFPDRGDRAGFRDRLLAALS
jgi:hypothetical protein